MMEFHTQREALADYVASERWEGKMEMAKAAAQRMFSRGDAPINIAEILGVTIHQVEEWVGIVNA